jgi:hypothetical protein
MSLPNDLLGRWWVEAIDSPDDPFWVGLRSAMVTFMSAGKDHVQHINGTGFFIDSGEDFGIILTAKHVLDGVYSTQTPHPRYAPSALEFFVPSTSKAPSLDPTKLKALWMGESAVALNVAYVNYNNSIDIASGILITQRADEHFTPASIPITLSMPKVGDVVQMITQGLEPPTQNVDQLEDGKRFALLVRRQIVLRMGVVTGVYQEGYRQYKWPCFTTSIPAAPGMSGGLVTIPKNGGTVAACGVVCADNSPPEAAGSFMIQGESVIGCVWPALTLRAPERIPVAAGTAQPTLFEWMRQGRMRIVGGGLDQIEVQNLGNDEMAMRLQPAPAS